MKETLNYYNLPSDITCLDKYKKFTEGLPADPGAIYQVTQGLILHDMWIERYGETYIEEHEYPQKIAYMEDILDKALELDHSDLTIPRHPRNRVIACCREFATLMCAILRAKGVPARSRCGFATYFGWDGLYEDHWICEYWNGERWVMADPQLDPLQQSSVLSWGMDNAKENNELLQRIQTFNPRDLKTDEFVTAGEAWIRCRKGTEDPERFGIGCPIRPEWGIDSLYGLWFIRGQLLRDFAALNKVETVPYLVRIAKGLDWNVWRLVGSRDEELTVEDLQLLDTIAELTLQVDANYQEIRRLYSERKDLRVPAELLER